MATIQQLSLRSNRAFFTASDYKNHPAIRLFLPLGIMMLLTLGLQAQKTWNGSGSDDWNTAGNWTPAGVPALTDPVIIPNTVTSPVIKTGISAFANSVQVNAGAQLTIESAAALKVEGAAAQGILSFGDIQNAGTIGVNDTGAEGIRNNAPGSFSNSGTIKIGLHNGPDNIGSHGIFNSGAFSNDDGSVFIDNTTTNGISNNAGVFENKNGGALRIGQTGDAGNISNLGVFNLAVFLNNGATISIDYTGNVGFWNLTTGSFTNSNGALLEIGRHGGPGSIVQAGCINQNIFLNDGSDLTVDNTGSIGFALSSGTVTNQNGANLRIGSLGSIGLEGINNSTNGNFFNTAANIFIDRTLDDGLLSFGNFTNSAGGHVAIGQSGGAGTIAQNGIVRSFGTFTNDAGSIVIDNVILRGISNSGSSGSFLNQNGGQITIGANGVIGQRSLFNSSAGSFQNGACSDIDLFDDLLHQNSNFVNDGFLRLNTSQASTVIGAGFVNNGVIEDVQGTFPAASVANNDLIVQPAAGPTCPGSVAGALLVGGANSFTVGSQWFTDEALSTFAGNYNDATNTFTETGLGSGVHTLFFEVSGGCTRVVSIRLTLEGPTPVEVCNGLDDDCDGLIDETDIAVSLPACKTVYVGYAPAASATLSAGPGGGVPPYNFEWSPGGAVTQSITVSPEVNTTYTVTVMDAHGCTATASIPVEAIDVRCGNNNNKVELCHNDKTKCVSQAEALTHLAHGDLLGACGITVCETYPPFNQNFAGYPGGSVAPHVQQRMPAESRMVIFPNPASGAVTVSIDGEFETGVMKLFDLQGRLLLHRALDAGNPQYVLTRSGFPSGIYLVQVALDGETFTQKLIVE